MNRYELAARQTLFMAEQYARERNPEVFRFPGSRAECSVVGSIIPRSEVRPCLPPVRPDDERIHQHQVAAVRS